jgi:hypothetical protein
VTAAQQALRHESAHFPKTDHRKFHSTAPYRVKRTKPQYSPVPGQIQRRCGRRAVPGTVSEASATP